MDGDQPLFDFSRLNFDEFVSFFFDHDIATEEFWYLDSDLLCMSDFDDEGVASPRVIVGHMTRLFTNFADIPLRFSPPQINAGIWAMLSHQPFRSQKHLWLQSTPLVERLDCIHSMYSVYAGYVAKSSAEVMENCFSMWWDWVASSFWQHVHFVNKIGEGDVASLNREQTSLLGAMFQTLSRILALTDRRTQEYSLHGLGHLHHPDVRNVVQRFLDSHRNELSVDAIRWVEECRDGTVM